mmetsp:Transcript_27621/g.44918  ORF Transcript_27621/g.44918 Transcript_27621/m.44918 type:complete len:209 (+) Transcript_27621:1089-1715(+)
MRDAIRNLMSFNPSKGRFNRGDTVEGTHNIKQSVIGTAEAITDRGEKGRRRNSTCKLMYQPKIISKDFRMRKERGGKSGCETTHHFCFIDGLKPTNAFRMCLRNRGYNDTKTCLCVCCLTRKKRSIGKTFLMANGYLGRGKTTKVMAVLPERVSVRDRKALKSGPGGEPICCVQRREGNHIETGRKNREGAEKKDVRVTKNQLRTLTL